ncbi:MAG TPA: DUF456 domain-containing protein [Balneolaceae bacterium]|nr:DUF456 domain-containing protein [Balneolaceae bacterium]
MDIIWIILGVILIISGFIGSFLPLIPGPPLSFLGLLTLQLTKHPPFSFGFLVFWAAAALLLLVLDNLIPAYGTKKSGGSPWGIGGSMLGLAIGIFFPPFGFIIGPLTGAFIGELLAGKNSQRAFKSALGSFLGFLTSTLLKIIACVFMGYYFFMAL